MVKKYNFKNIEAKWPYFASSYAEASVDKKATDGRQLEDQFTCVRKI